MGFVDEHQEIVREVIHQGAGGAPRLPPRQHPGVVLDALAEADLQQHLHVVAGALGDALGLDEFAVLAEELHPLVALPAYLLHRLHDPLPWDDVVGGRIDGQVADEVLHLPGNGVDLGDAVDLVPEELHPIGGIGGVGGVDLHHVPPDPEFVADKVQVVALVLEFHQLFDQLVPLLLHPLAQGDDHVLVVDGVPQAVDAGDAGHDDDVPPLRQGGGGGVAQPLDLVVDGAVLFDVGVGGGDVGLRLVVVVVADEIFHRVFGKKLAEFTVELSGQSFVGRENQGRSVAARDHVRHRECFARTGDAKQNLIPDARFDI